MSSPSQPSKTKVPCGCPPSSTTGIIDPIPTATAEINADILKITNTVASVTKPSAYIKMLVHNAIWTPPKRAFLKWFESMFSQRCMREDAILKLYSERMSAIGEPEITQALITKLKSIEFRIGLARSARESVAFGNEVKHLANWTESWSLKMKQVLSHNRVEKFVSQEEEMAPELNQTIEAEEAWRRLNS